MDEFERIAAESQLHGPKRHHYVSKFYLDGFTDYEGLLQVFDRQTGEIRPQKPTDTTVIGHFYTFIDEDDRRRFELEKLFGIIETAAGSALKTIDKGGHPTQKEREYLASSAIHSNDSHPYTRGLRRGTACQTRNASGRNKAKNRQRAASIFHRKESLTS
jgi:hypothetical protein